MRIYTKTGDKGTTSYIGGRISKDASLINALGGLDELNANVGLILSDQFSLAKHSHLQKRLEQTQSILFTLGAALANPNLEKGLNLAKETHQLEADIDKLSLELPELKHFLLPGGNRLAAEIHLARTVCRRVERQVVEVMGTNTEPNDIYLKSLSSSQIYLNRLSDWFFLQARNANHVDGRDEVIWQSGG